MNVGSGRALASALMVVVLGACSTPTEPLRDRPEQAGEPSAEEPSAGEPSDGIGVFAPFKGRVVYMSGDWGFVGDRGYDPGAWAVDPNGPSDPKAGPGVDADVASTLVRLGLDDEPDVPEGWSIERTRLLGWSRDGTELLITRWNANFEEYLFVLHADGSETRLHEDPMLNPVAAISPDGSRVAFLSEGLRVVDVAGGWTVPLSYPAGGEPGGQMAFSPDGTEIAYVTDRGVWVVNADGSEPREVVANQVTRASGPDGLQWSPAGDRLAIEVDAAIYTFAPDGSGFTKVIDGGFSPYWSPDGSRIAFTIPCDEHPSRACPERSALRRAFDPQPGDFPAGLAVADADGSDVRAFGFAASGPWHPGS